MHEQNVHVTLVQKWEGFTESRQRAIRSGSKWLPASGENPHRAVDCINVVAPTHQSSVPDNYIDISNLDEKQTFGWGLEHYRSRFSARNGNFESRMSSSLPRRS